MNWFCMARLPFQNRVNCYPRFLHLLTALLAGLAAAGAIAQTPSPSQLDAITVDGTVRNSAGEPVMGASVVLEEKGGTRRLETKTDAEGRFSFIVRHAGMYTATVEKPGFGKCVTDPMPLLSVGQKKQLELRLQPATAEQPSSSSAAASSGAMEFKDEPNFTVAGVTDWSGAGGHGSDTSLRTSEALARETLALKSSGPGETSRGAAGGNAAGHESMKSENKLRAAAARTPDSFEANHQLGEFYLRSGKYREAISSLAAAYQIKGEDVANAYDLALAYRGNGDLVLARDLAVKTLAKAEGHAGLHGLLGDLDERLGDPLGAVREYDRAATLDPSEPNYFEWGTELLLHRAVRPAVIVFKKGTDAHPNSARMLVGLGAALYADGSYEEAAGQLCRASDLKPEDATPYLFLGRMEVTSPTSFSCGEQKLARFAQNQPGNALANYYFAMAVLKRDRESISPADSQQVEMLLKKSLAIDPKLGEAYLQLGILYAAQGANEQAIAAFKKAVEVTPGLSEAHYRLSQLYKRSGEKAKADQEIQLYKQVEKSEADEVERQRREIQQFLIILKDQPAVSAPH
ncbi:MAG TPA: tetratricopeptide repeat protein [Candidatus Acidoferrum sp.]|nr:tetratricopeptide repeat protein [Candidatus Acidoferrum sp.]